MLPLERAGGLAPCGFEDIDPHDLHILTIGPCRGMEVADEVVRSVCIDICSDNTIDHRRIDQRAVGRNLHDSVGSGFEPGAIVPVEQVERIAAVAADADLPAEQTDRIVGGIDRGRDYDLVGRRCRNDTRDHALQQRLSCQRHQHLAGKTGASRASLYDDNGSWHRFVRSRIG
jgi:hypothetical protein